MYQIHKDLKSLATPMDKCQLDPKNARVGHDVDGIAESLKKFGQRKPIVVNKKSGIIIAGNGTYKGAMQLGWKNIAALFVEESTEASTGFAIADNRLGDKSVFDAHALQELFNIVSPSDIPGVDDKFLSEIGYIEESADSGRESDPKDDIIPEKAEPVCKAGQLWQLGEHRLFCGDCTDKGNIALLMGDEKADLFLTDPPYGVSYADKNASLNKWGKGYRIQTEIENDHKPIDEMRKLWTQVFNNAHAVTSDKCSYYIFSCQGGDLMMMMMMMSISDAKWQRKHMLIWVKNNHVLGRADYAYKHEPVLYGWKEGCTHKYYGGFQTSILEYDKPLKSDLHPTMKPVAIIEKLIVNSSIEAETILDPFGGSGTTLIACEKTNRKCRMMEISPDYCDIIIKRWEDFTNKKAELIS